MVFRCCFFFFLGLISFHSLAQERFIDLCDHAEERDHGDSYSDWYDPSIVISDTKQIIRWLKFIYKTEDCRRIANNISKHSSFDEFMPRSFSNSDSKSWLEATSFIPSPLGTLEEENTFKHLYYKLPAFDNLSIFTEFTNLSHITFNASFTSDQEKVCEILAHFPEINMISIRYADEIKQPALDCILKRNLTIIVREEAKDIPEDLLDLKIIGIEKFVGDIQELYMFPHLRFVEIPKYEGEGNLNVFSVMANLTHLSLNIAYVKNIRDVRYLKNLKYLRLKCENFKTWDRCEDLPHKPSLKNLNFLTGLNWLETLDVSNNQVEDIAALASLKHLKHLNLSRNSISSFPDNLLFQKLEYLNLAENSISEIKFLKSMKNLVFLNVAVNEVSDFTPLETLHSLTHLNISYNRSDDILSFSPPSSLKYLFMNGTSALYVNKIPRYFKNLPSLEREYLEDLGTTIIVGYRAYTNLSKWFEIHSEKLKNVTYLEINGNHLISFPDLSHLTKLKVLYANHNLISLFPMSLPSSLLEIDLTHNRVSRIESLQSLPNLKALTLTGNKLTNVQAIYQHPELERVAVNHNQITDLSFFNDPLLAHIFLFVKDNPISKDTKACPVDSPNETVREFCLSYLSN